MKRKITKRKKSNPKFYPDDDYFIGMRIIEQLRNKIKTLRHENEPLLLHKLVQNLEEFYYEKCK